MDSLRPLRVVLVEDNEVDAELTARALRRAGYEPDLTRVETEEDFVSALLGDRRPDLILADYHVPGFVALEAVAVRNQRAPDIPFVLVSGAVGEEEAVHVIRAGADDFVLKDRLDRLDIAITQSLEQARLRREHRDTLDALRANEARFRLLASVIPDVMYIFRSAPDPGFEFLSPSVERVTGYSPAYFYEHGVDLVRALVDRPTRLEGRRAVPGDERPTLNTLERRDGETVWLEHRYRTVVEGERTLIIGVARDVTEARRTEDQLHHARTLDVLGNLAGALAHDFNNLLTVILGFADLAREGADDGAVSEQLTEIINAGERARTLVGQLLTLGRNQVLEMRAVQPVRAVERMAKLLHRVAGEVVDVEFDLWPTEAIRIGDGQLEQILLNLVINARDATPSGGTVTVTVRPAALEPVRAEDLGCPPGSYVAVTVSDTGEGMSKDVLERAFDPFFSTKDAAGTGLGLATVQGVARQLGGGVGLTSEPGQGTVCRVFLPTVGEETGLPSDTEYVETRQPRGNETLLVVEDSRAVRRFMVSALDQAGFEVLEASHAEHARALVTERGRDIDLLVTDVVMPNVSGPDLADELRGRLKHPRVLFISGYTSDPGAIRATPGRFLAKPFTARDLTQRVRYALDHPDD